MGKYTWKYFGIISIFLLILLLTFCYRPIRENFTELTVSAVAGSGTQGSADGSGANARFNLISGLVFDSVGNLYVCDRSANKIRKIDSSYNVTTIAGSGAVGALDGQGTSASFNAPSAIAIDKNGILYVSDQLNYKIRKIDTSFNVTTIAGSGTTGASEGQGASASFVYPSALAVDSNNNIYVCDSHKIRKIDSSYNVTTVAGLSTSGSLDGQGISASFNSPAGLVIDSSNNLYVCDKMNKKIRKIDSSFNVSTIAGSGTVGQLDGQGTSASFSSPTSITITSTGILYVCDGSKIRKISTTYEVTTVSTVFSDPYAITIDNSNNLYVGDNYKIHKITMGTTGTTGTTGSSSGSGSSASSGSSSGSSTGTATSCPDNFTLRNGVCSECSGTQKSQGGTTSCVNLTCPANQKAVNHACVPCEEGSYSSGGISSSCITCGSGRSINNGVCTSCAPGKYSDSPGQSSCSSCGAGTYSSASGSSVCLKCSAGKYQDAEGQSSCKKCESGTYQGQEGKTSCMSCPAGKYSSTDGLSYCTSCSRGTYQDKTGQKSCINCPKDTYSDTLGNEKCTPCPEGSFTVDVGATSGSQCVMPITQSNCLNLYNNAKLAFNSSNAPTGISRYHGLTADSFSLASGIYNPYESVGANLAKCILNKRLQDRSEVCKGNSEITINSCGTAVTDSKSLLQAYEYVNAKGICVDKGGVPIPYPTLPPRGTRGSPDSVLAHVVNCTNPEDAKTCSYNYPIGGVNYQINPCVGRNLIYDFDKEDCVDPGVNTVDGETNNCQTYQVFDTVTGKCLDVTVPIKSMPPNTKGKLVEGDYRDCKTTNMGDCTVVYKNRASDITQYARTTNPCPTSANLSNIIFNFDTYRCEPKTETFTDYKGRASYRLETPIIS